MIVADTCLLLFDGTFARPQFEMAITTGSLLSTLRQLDTFYSATILCDDMNKNVCVGGPAPNTTPVQLDS